MPSHSDWLQVWQLMAAAGDVKSCPMLSEEPKNMLLHSRDSSRVVQDANFVSKLTK